VSEAEVVDAPGRGPGGSGFEPRRTPSVIYTCGSAVAQYIDTEIADPSACCRAHWKGGGTT